MSNSKVQKRIVRHKRIRAKVIGTAEKPRLAVSRSNNNIIAQLIDDSSSKTLVYAWTKTVDGKTLKDKAEAVGKKIAEEAKAKKISEVVFDRGGFVFTGNIKVLAEAARAGGLKF